MIEMTLGGLLDKVAAEYHDVPGVIHAERGFRETYGDFRDHCNRVARGMIAMGIKKGDKVAIWATNYTEWLLTMFASAKIGAILVTVNTNYKIYELEYLLRQSDTSTLVLIDGFKDSNYVEIINTLCPSLASSKPGELKEGKLPFLKNVVHIGSNRQPGMFNWEDIEDMAAGVPPEALESIEKSLDCHDVVNMQYTSGTTGFPKGVMLTHHNLTNNGLAIGDGMLFTPKDKLCISVPLFHCFGCVLGVMASLTHAVTMVLVDYFRPAAVMDAIQRERCTAVHGVPTMFIAMLEHADFQKYDMTSLRTGIMAGSPCPIQTMREVIDKMHMRDITIIYGLTEASPGCTQTVAADDIEHKVRTVGRPFPFVECRVADPETNLPLGPGIPGEFQSRGYNSMKGYYNMPEATAQAFTPDGWLHTGDMAVMGTDGYYRITGRLKDMIIRGGENIYPREIEDFLYTHPCVSDAQVVGIPSKIYGEEVMAFVILKKGAAVTADELKDFVRSNMARHKTPKYVEFLSEFPMTASGKVQKFKLRDMAVEILGLSQLDE